jgi:hypothetical protein
VPLLQSICTDCSDCRHFMGACSRDCLGTLAEVVTPLVPGFLRGNDVGVEELVGIISPLLSGNIVEEFFQISLNSPNHRPTEWMAVAPTISSHHGGGFLVSILSVYTPVPLYQFPPLIFQSITRIRDDRVHLSIIHRILSERLKPNQIPAVVEYLAAGAPIGLQSRNPVEFLREYLRFLMRLIHTEHLGTVADAFLSIRSTVPTDLFVESVEGVLEERRVGEISRITDKVKLRRILKSIPFKS